MSVVWRGRGGRGCAEYPSSPPLSPVIPDAPAGFQTIPTRRKARGNAADDGDDPTHVGSISHDRVKNEFNLEWEDLDYFNGECTLPRSTPDLPPNREALHFWHQSVLLQWRPPCECQALPKAEGCGVAVNCIGEINCERAQAPCTGDPRAQGPVWRSQAPMSRATQSPPPQTPHACGRCTRAEPLRLASPAFLPPSPDLNSPPRPIPAPSQPLNTQCPPVNYMYSYSSAFYFPNTQ